MLYNSLKIIHILSAALLLTSMGYSYLLWRNNTRNNNTMAISYRIQIQTWLAITPLAFFQLGTGFTMISMHLNELSSLWISCTVISFTIAIASWFSFIYLLLLSQQITLNTSSRRYDFLRQAQSLMLSICAIAMFSMIFLMANKSH